MSRVPFATRFSELVALAGVEVGGGHPWDIVVRDSSFFARVLAGGSLALGEAYMDGWWDSPRLDEFFARVLGAQLDRRVRSPRWLLDALRARLFNLQAGRRAFTIGERHYDLGNELYRTMLDRRMVYSCAYWESASSLDEAQEAKLDLVCRKLDLQPGMKVLDIGCGWGGAARFAAERYGVEVVGLTVSRQQAELAREECRGLPIDIRLEDYRDLEGRFDRVLSLGMFEHVGYKNYRSFFSCVRRVLRDDGLFLLHTIGGVQAVTHQDPWIEKYIFPNSMIPSPGQVSRALEGLFVLEDWHCFGTYYDPTLLCWFRNFDDGWDRLRHHYDDRFYRMWKYYLLSCAGSFRARTNDVWQLLLSPRGLPGGYRRPRSS